MESEVYVFPYVMLKASRASIFAKVFCLCGAVSVAQLVCFVVRMCQHGQLSDLRMLSQKYVQHQPKSKIQSLEMDWGFEK